MTIFDNDDARDADRLRDSDHAADRESCATESCVLPTLLVELVECLHNYVGGIAT